MAAFDMLKGHGVSLDHADSSPMFTMLPAELQYLGTSGISRDCLDSISGLLSKDKRISRALLLSAEAHHAFILSDDAEVLTAVKPGFTSGYRGEGPRTLALALHMLEQHGAEIEEIDVQRSLIESIGKGSLSAKDCRRIGAAIPVRPNRWRDYLYSQFGPDDRVQDLSSMHSLTMPWAIIDHRIHDLALDFFSDPDRSILTGFRRLEDLVRARLGSVEVQSGRVLAAAFVGGDSPFSWPDTSPGEHHGRANLFTGAYQAYRNPRAHGEMSSSPRNSLSEFLMLNHLYGLEKTARPRVVCAAGPSDSAAVARN